MAKTRPSKKSHSKTKHSSGKQKMAKAEDPAELYEQATALLQTGQPEVALPIVDHALEIALDNSPAILAGLNLSGEILVELGDIDSARERFLTAVSIDPHGQMPESEGGGAEKFLWLAQLSEEGGNDSVSWYEKGVTILRRNIQQLESGSEGKNISSLEDNKQKLAQSLCAVAEIYMTDLSWEEDAEARCEALVTEALMVTPESPECLQTLASVRISQLRQDDARAALARSLALWQDLDPDDEKVPDFPTRVALTRLLMEVQMEAEALEVLERMVLEDDESVETWYLGGWCLYLIGKGDAQQIERLTEEQRKSTLRSSVRWLRTSLRLYGLIQYEDEKLKEHAEELVTELVKDVGEVDENETDDEDSDESENEDETMAES